MECEAEEGWDRVKFIEAYEKYLYTAAAFAKSIGASHAMRLNLTAGGKKGVAKGAHSVVQGDTAVSSRATPTERQQPMQKEDTSAISNRSVSNSDSAFDKALRSMGIVGEDSSMKEQARHEASPLLMALRVCGLTAGTTAYRDNYRSFSRVMQRCLQ